MHRPLLLATTYDDRWDPRPARSILTPTTIGRWKVFVTPPFFHTFYHDLMCGDAPCQLPAVTSTCHQLRWAMLPPTLPTFTCLDCAVSPSLHPPCTVTILYQPAAACAGAVGGRSFLGSLYTRRPVEPAPVDGDMSIAAVSGRVAAVSDEPSHSMLHVARPRLDGAWPAAEAPDGDTAYSGLDLNEQPGA